MTLPIKRVLTLIASITAVALLFYGVNPPPAHAATDDLVVTYDFEDPAVADPFRAELTAIDDSGKQLNEVVQEQSKGQLHDVMPDLSDADFDHTWSVEGTVVTITVTAPEAEVDVNWRQAVAIVVLAFVVGSASALLCEAAAGPPPLCAGVGSFMSEFTNSAVTQLADGKGVTRTNGASPWRSPSPSVCSPPSAAGWRRRRPAPSSRRPPTSSYWPIGRSWAGSVAVPPVPNGWQRP
ncbi:hypothetical protein ACQEWB_06375 [Streptomyces sp. CA-249302]|uniref:hypothetical protein n=1 Tax=Streptomyces sp. CA-249302 TaxID=3240058 RepID=UPI003D8C2D08